MEKDNTSKDGLIHSNIDKLYHNIKKLEEKNKSEKDEMNIDIDKIENKTARDFLKKFLNSTIDTLDCAKYAYDEVDENGNPVKYNKNADIILGTILRTTIYSSIRQMGLFSYQVTIEKLKNNKDFIKKRPWIKLLKDKLPEINDCDYAIYDTDYKSLHQLIKTQDADGDYSEEYATKFEKALGFISNNTKPKDYLPVPHHNGTWDMIFNMGKLKNGTIDFLKTKRTVKTKTGDIELQGDENFSLDALIDMLSDTQLQVINYIMGVSLEKNYKRIIPLNINDYFKLKNIKRDHKSVDRLINDLHLLEHTHFNFECTIKNKKIIGYGKCLSIMGFYYSGDKDTPVQELINGRKLDCVSIALGDWVETLSPEQYTLLSNQTFKYNPSRNPYVIKLSLKLAELTRNNLKKGKEQNSIMVSKILSLLDIKNKDIVKRGFTYYKDKIENALDMISEMEGYQWEYQNGNHNSYVSFKNDYILYTNKKYIDAYSNYKLIKG